MISFISNSSQCCVGQTPAMSSTVQATRRALSPSTAIWRARVATHVRNSPHSRANVSRRCPLPTMPKSSQGWAIGRRTRDPALPTPSAASGAIRFIADATVADVVTKPMREGNRALLERYEALFAADRVAVLDVSEHVVDPATLTFAVTMYWLFSLPLIVLLRWRLSRSVPPVRSALRCFWMPYPRSDFSLNFSILAGKGRQASLNRHLAFALAAARGDPDCAEKFAALSHVSTGPSVE